MEQNFSNTAVNEWRKRLLACVHIVGQHFKKFYCRQLKMDKWLKCQPKCQKCEQNVFLRFMLINQSYCIKKVIFCWLRFPQVVQIQTLGEVGNWIVIWWQVVSGIFMPKIIKILLLVFKLQSKMSGMFFLRHSVHMLLECWTALWLLCFGCEWEVVFQFFAGLVVSHSCVQSTSSVTW